MAAFDGRVDITTRGMGAPRVHRCCRASRDSGAGQAALRGSAHSCLRQAVPVGPEDRQRALWAQASVEPPGLGRQEPRNRRQTLQGEAGRGPAAGLRGTAWLTREDLGL